MNGEADGDFSTPLMASLPTREPIICRSLGDFGIVHHGVVVQTLQRGGDA
jgi:hypothetical protein